MIRPVTTTMTRSRRLSKSMRGSDPGCGGLLPCDACCTLGRISSSSARTYYDLRVSEDVGNADPQALAGCGVGLRLAVERIGMPEAQIILAQAVTYIATAPKSNASYLGIDKAMAQVAGEKTAVIPPHLQDAHYKSAAKLGHGTGYLYAHDYPMHYVKQQYLPDTLVGRRFL